MEWQPETKIGRWSVELNIFFLIAIIISLILVKFFGFDFGNHWWDVTVFISFSANIIAFIVGIIAVTKKKEHSVLVYLSILIGFLTILFILLHSLFISD